MGGGWMWGIYFNKEDGKIYGLQFFASEMVFLLEERGFIVDKKFKSWQR